MTLIQLRSIGKLYGGSTVLRGLDLRVAPDARLGLIGGNGAGKSTLLRILAGLESVHEGEVTRRRRLRCAYLSQKIDGDGRTPLEVVADARPELVEVRSELAECEARLGSPEVATDMRKMQRLLERQEELLNRFGELGGRGFEGEARSRLRELRLDDEDLRRPTSELSGGQRKLVVLAACLMQKPDVLLLDEPESHLDSDKRERLEFVVQDFDGAVVIVSHDRYLLDETVDNIAELENGKVTLWSGNYSAYKVAKELALKRQQQLYVAQQKEIARLEEAVRCFKLWASLVVNERHIRQARVKQRQIDSMEKVERPVLERRKIGLELHSRLRGGQKVLELTNACIAFGDEPILMDLNLTVGRGERVGVVGPNGAGKSALLKTLYGALPLAGGESWAGPSIETGYLAQDHEPLSPDATPVSLVRDAKPMYEDEAVKLLLRFLFSYEQTQQPARTLSGGEMTRLRLLLLMLGRANCLILDEPTNHLDIDSLEVLEDTLERYDGTVVFVSHDRYFLDRMADRIFEVRDGNLLCYEGGFSFWREMKSKSRTEAGHAARHPRR